MKTRRRMLPPGWYPETAAETRAAIERFLAVAPPPPVRAEAAVAPHAGWEFSGRLALEAIRAFPPDRETIVVVGGHLSPSDPILAAAEDELETPLGGLRSDGDLLRSITSRIPLETDRSPDNTVEVQLPFIKYLFPRSRVLALRAPPSAEAIRLGIAILEASRELKRKVAVLGSTDLTHYGGNYGFAPAGRGERGLNWVREVNDREFIERLLDMDAEGAIEHAEANKSACSAGGAVTALSFARGLGARAGTLVKYMTSNEVYPGESFVGYAAIVFAL